MNFHDFFAEIIEIAEPDGGFGVALATFAPSAPPRHCPQFVQISTFRAHPDCLNNQHLLIHLFIPELLSI
jgi:hypothetical protein